MESSDSWIRLVVEIDASDGEGAAPHGRIGGDDGCAEEFHGWTSLAAAIERRRGTPAPHPESTSPE